MFKVKYKVEAENQCVVLSRWFWQSEYEIYRQVQSLFGDFDRHVIRVTRVK